MDLPWSNRSNRERVPGTRHEGPGGSPPAPAPLELFRFSYLCSVRRRTCVKFPLSPCRHARYKINGMKRVLFLDSQCGWRCGMAVAFARSVSKGQWEFSGACVEPAPAPVPEGALRAMAEVGADDSTMDVAPLSDRHLCEFDVVVALCSSVLPHCPQLPGMPMVINWELLPEASPDELDAVDAGGYREARDEVRRLVECFCNHGCLPALLTSGAHTRTVLDSVNDGIIAHDMERRICYVNAAAEQISGYRREEAFGKDCHEVFPGNLCSGKCLFCESDVVPFLPQQRNVEIATKSGERRQVDMTVYPIVASDGAGDPVGVIAVFRDQTREKRLARRAREIEHFAGIIGRDDKMLEIFDLIRDLADSSVPVLIQGDSGTGKELIAAAIHNEGPRANQLFVPVNCGALPESLLESELFGHVKGAFTGAIRDSSSDRVNIC